jgi:hypothetical protein
MLEALALGAFPIQTNASCCEEWIENGKNGFSIPPDGVEFIVQEAATNDGLVDRSQLNWGLVSRRLDGSVLQKAGIQDYRKLLEL